MNEFPDYEAAAKAMWLISSAPSARWEDLSSAFRGRLVAKATVGVDAALGDEPLHGSPYIDVKELLLEMLDYVPGYFRDKWNLDAQVGTVVRMWPQEQPNGPVGKPIVADSEDEPLYRIDWVAFEEQLPHEFAMIAQSESIVTRVWPKEER